MNACVSGMKHPSTFLEQAALSPGNKVFLFTYLLDELIYDMECAACFMLSDSF